MKNQNQSETTSAKHIENAIGSLDALRKEMTFLKALTPKDRRSVPRVTLSSLTLMEDALQAARENQTLMPPSIELARYEDDVQASRGLYNLLTKLHELSSDVQDTLSTVGKEANSTTQQVRVLIRTVAKTKPTPGLKLLSQRLHPRSGRSAAKEVTETPAPPPPPPPAASPAPGPAPSTETKAA